MRAARFGLAVFLTLFRLTPALVLYPDPLCSSGGCDADSQACPTAQCTDIFDSCEALPGYIQVSEELAPDEKDCMDNGCTADDCPSGWKRMSQELCVSTHCKSLFCFQEACCKLRKRVSCCKTAPCSVHYGDCQIPQEKKLDDPSTSNLYFTKVAHTGSATFPFYSQPQAPKGATCQSLRTWGQCYCNDGVPVPGCLPAESITWYDFENEHNVSLPASLSRTCAEYINSGSTDSGTSSSTGQQPTTGGGAPPGGSSGTSGADGGAGGTGGEGDPSGHGVDNGHGARGGGDESSPRGFSGLVITGTVFGAVCAAALLALAVWKKREVIANKWSISYRQLLLARTRGRSPPPAGSSSNSTYAGGGWHSFEAGGILHNTLPVVPEEDEVFTLEDLTDAEMGLRSEEQDGVRLLAEMEMHQLKAVCPPHEAKGKTAEEMKKQSALNISPHIEIPSTPGGSGDDRDEEDALVSTPPRDGKSKVWPRRNREP